MNLEKEVQDKLDELDSEIERIRAFAENLAVTEDYKMDYYSDEGGWEKLDIDAYEIAQDLLKLVEVAHDKCLELSKSLDGVKIETN